MLRIQSKNVFSHWRGTNRVRPSSTAAIAGAASTRGVAKPLVGQPRLDDHPRAVVMRHHQDVVFDLVDQPGCFEIGKHLLARRKPVETAIGRRHGVVQPGIAIEDVDQRRDRAGGRPRNR